MENISNIIWTSVIAAALLIWSVLTLVNCYEGEKKKTKKATGASTQKVSETKKSPTKKTAVVKKTPTKKKQISKK